jgi:hypothetical protein
MVSAEAVEDAKGYAARGARDRWDEGLGSARQTMTEHTAAVASNDGTRNHH